MLGLLGGGIIAIGSQHVADRRWPLTIAALLVVSSAIIGSRGARHRSFGLLLRNILLAVSAAAYPVFLGGAFSTLAMIAHLALIAASWLPDVPPKRIAVVQAFAVSLAMSVAATAMLFFYPDSWLGIILVALVGFSALLVARELPLQVSWREVCVAVGVAVLLLGEVLMLFRYLPAHWAMHAAMLALIVAAIMERERRPQTLFASLVMVLLLVGTLT